MLGLPVRAALASLAAVAFASSAAAAPSAPKRGPTHAAAAPARPQRDAARAPAPVPPPVARAAAAICRPRFRVEGKPLEGHCGFGCRSEPCQPMIAVQVPEASKTAYTRPSPGSLSIAATSLGFEVVQPAESVPVFT